MGDYLTQVTPICSVRPGGGLAAHVGRVEARFATEDACRAHLLVQLRWTNGFRSSRCGHAKAWPVRTVLFQTSFTAKTDFRGSRENLHLVERWTRINATTLEYEVTIEDPTTWTRPWTIRQELTLQNGQANRVYYEPRCHEGNYGLPGQLVGTRLEKQAFAEGRGPDPATKDTVTDFGGAGGRDPIGR